MRRTGKEARALEELGKFAAKTERIREFMRRETLWIRDKSGELRPLQLSPAQAEFERTCGRKNIVLKARQLGMTTYVAARFFLDTVLHPGTLTVQVAHDQRSAEQIFRIVHRFLENLPEDLGDVLRTSRANVRQIVFPAIDSEYRVETAADPHAGRGLTIQNLHCSEVAMWPGEATATLAALRAAVPPDGRITLESTPKGACGAFYDEWRRMDSGYVHHFYPWWREPGYRREGVAVGRLTEEERELVSKFGLDEAQIAFRREMRATFGASAPEEFVEDPETCFRTSGEPVFDMEKVEQRLASATGPCETGDNGRLQVWWPPAPGRRYILGVDPAGGGPDGDAACIQVIERELGRQCAEWLGRVRPEELAAEVARLGRRYGKALAVIERNNHGHAVLACLTMAENYDALYRERGEAGWLTTAANRPAILGRLVELVRSRPELVESARLLGEFRTFVRGTQGRPEAAQGSHDDAVMAMALAQAVRAGLG